MPPNRSLRSVYLSLKRNTPYLWMVYDNPDLGMPNTNNALEGTFTDIKPKLRVHSGIKKANLRGVFHGFNLLPPPQMTNCPKLVTTKNACYKIAGICHP